MPRILFLTAYPLDDASCRYRVHQFVPHLEQAGYEVTISTFASPRLFSILKHRGKLVFKALHTLYNSARRIARLSNLSDFDFIVIHREAFPFFAPFMENWLVSRASGKSPRPKIIFSFDDAIYAGHHDTSTLSHPWLYRVKHGRGYDQVIRRSDHVIAGNRILAAYARKLNPSVSVVPTVVDCHSYRMKPLPADPSGPLTIGWIGSPTTSPYLSLVEPVLQRLVSTHGSRVRFRFFGNPQYKPDLPHFTSLPFRLSHEVHDLQSLDIGIMPLPDTEWTRGKCAFKAIQYMATGACAVASPVGVTTDLITHNVNGFLADSQQDWFQCLTTLVENAALRDRIPHAARLTIERSYSLEAWGPRFVEIFDQLSRGPRILPVQRIAA
jgi:glycosyltransferase involved in cell wall biosynthesis